MIKDAVWESMKSSLPAKKLKDVKLSTKEYENGVFGLECSNWVLLIGFMLRRQRLGAHLTAEQLAIKRGSDGNKMSTSIELGVNKPQLSTIIAFLEHVNPKQNLILTLR